MKYDKQYDDIINLPHHVSKKHPQMSLYARSAQFAPFAALTGFEEIIKETEKEAEEEENGFVGDDVLDVPQML